MADILRPADFRRTAVVPEAESIDDVEKVITTLQPVDLSASQPIVQDEDGNELSVNVTDGDTAILTDAFGNERSARFPGVDTAERVKLVGDVFAPGSLTGNTQQQFAEEMIAHGGFNKLVDTGKEDVYGRSLEDFVRADGTTLSDYMVAERIADPNKYTTREQMRMRSANILQDMVGFYGREVGPQQKARDIINAQLSTGPSFKLELASSEKEYKDHEHWRSYKGVQQQANEIERLEGKLKSAKTEEERNLISADIQDRKEILQDMILRDPKYYGWSGQGQEKGFFEEVEDSFIGGLYQLEGNAANFAYWAGDLLGSEDLENWGAEWAKDNRRDIARYTKGNQGLWNIKGAGDALQFTANTVAQYGPQLGVILGAGKTGGLIGTAIAGPVGGAVGATVGSLGASFVLAVSSVYEEQPEGEKDPITAAGIAVPIMLLEKYGADKFGPLASKLKGQNVLTDEGLDATADIMSEALGITKDQAVKRINKDLLEVTREASMELSDLAAQQLVAKQNFKDIINTAAKSIGNEAVTESLQELIQGGGIALTTSVTFDYKEMGKRMIEGGIVGGIAGSPFGVYQGVQQHAEINEMVDAHYDLGPQEAPKDFRVVDAAHIQNGGMITVEEAIKRSRQSATREQENLEDLTLESLADKDKATYKKAAIDMLKNPISSVRSFVKNMVVDDLTKDDPALTEIAGMINAIKGVYVGSSIPSTIRRYNGQMLSSLSSQTDLMRSAGVNTKGELDALRQADPNTLTVSQRNVLDQMRQEESKMMEKVIGMMKSRGMKLNPDVEKYYRDGYLEKTGLIDPTKIDDSLIDVIADMPDPSIAKPVGQGIMFKANQETKLGRDFAIQFVENMRTNPMGINTLRTADSLKLSTDPRFAPYRMNNLTTRDRAVIIANKLSNRIAKDGVEEFLVKKLHASKLSSEKKAELAAKLQQLLKMIDGQFNRINNKAIKNIQEGAMVASQFAYMDTNFFANSADLVYGMMRLKSWGQLGSYVSTFGKSWAKGMYSDITIGGEKITRGKVERTQKWDLSPELARLRLTGHLAEKSETIQIEGANVSTPMWSNFSSFLFKLNLVEAYTDSTKAAVGASFWQDFSQLVGIVADARVQGINTKAAQQATRRMRNYNANPDWWVQQYINLGKEGFTEEAFSNISDPSSQFYQEAMENYSSVAVNYIDEFTARPEAGSGWKVSEDEHARMFTQYKRFISHFTANIIPNMWNTYLLHGSPKVKFSVFRNIMLTFAMAYTAQALKDMLKYGEEAPYLEEWDENLWKSAEARAARYTGWAGTPEMAFDAIMQYREDKWKSHPQRMLELLLDQSAVANTVYQVGTSSDPVRAAIGKTPFLADIEATREHLLGLK